MTGKLIILLSQVTDVSRYQIFPNLTSVSDEHNNEATSQKGQPN